MDKVRTGRESLSSRSSRLALFLFGATLLLAAAKCSSAQQPEPEGIEEGNYNIKQSVEFGYRFTDVTGSQETYDTFVNLQHVLRKLTFTTEMRSLNHQGLFF